MSKLKITKNEYTGSNFILKVSEDLKEVSAYSYDHWKFITTDKVGNIYFNYCYYSQSTRHHQGEASSLLRRLNIKVNLYLRYTKEDFREWYGTSYSIQETLGHEIATIKNDIKDLIKKIKTKRSWHKVNIIRRLEIKHSIKRIYYLRDIKNNYVDKKPIPIHIEKTSVLKKWTEYKKDNWYRYDLIDANKLKRYYFKDYKTNKIDWHNLNKLLNIKSVSYAIPKNIDKIKALLGINNNINQVVSLLSYEFIKDTNDMIPSLDTKEYLELKKWIKRMHINKQALNMLHLEKLHAYLINKQNRRVYNESEKQQPVYFPINNKLLNIKHDKLKLIKTPKELRAEGRQQNHCIGSKQYIEMCLRGYQAVNFKGYTFLLKPDNTIAQTHGSHNKQTPKSIQEEFLKLVA